jgi:uncharacterized protein (TIGR02757 family)
MNSAITTPSAPPSAPRGRAARLAPFLERLHARRHHPESIGLDPLRWPRAFDSREDREVAAFLASALAYGNVKQIDRSLGDLFRRMGRSPARFAREFVPGRFDRALDSFYHRFNSARDLAALIHAIGQMLRGWGSIEGFWADAQRGGEGGGDAADRAGRFIRAARDLDYAPYFGADGPPPRSSFLYLLPQADGPSAAKRLFLFLRWVVRPDDGVDLGLWTTERPADLQYPLDTHIHRIARHLGATRRRTPGAATRREITRFFACVDPADPVRFDFALCRMGILRQCPRRSDLNLCAVCDLRPECLHHRRMALAERRARSTCL